MGDPIRRFSESNAPTSGAEGHDFMDRHHSPPSKLLYVVFLAAFAGIFAAAQYIPQMGGPVIFGFVLFVILAILALATTSYTQRHRDIVLATEFQNALFTAAANMRTKFSLIVNRNGTISYYSPNYPKVFRDARRKGLISFDSLLDSDGIAADDNNRIRSAMAEGRHDYVLCTLTNIDGEAERLRLSIAPIPRPKGFFLVSVSELERRHDRRQDASAPETVLLTDSFDHLPCGVLTSDINGTVKHINRTLEKWLGYGHGEVTAGRFKREQIIASLSMGNDVFQGVVRLQKKSGEMLEMYLSQTPVIDVGGNVAGVCSILELPEKKTLTA